MNGPVPIAEKFNTQSQGRERKFAVFHLIDKTKRNEQGYSIRSITARMMGSMLLCAGLLVGCIQPAEVVEESWEQSVIKPEEGVSEDMPEESTEKSVEDIIREQLEKMSLEEKAGQVLFLALRRNQEGRPLQQLGNDEKTMLNTIQPGGIILFNENIHDNEQVKNLIVEMQAAAGIPLFMAVDQEGGRVSRLTGGEMIFPETPSARELGQTGDVDNALEVGKLLGRELKALGFNMNMAPVADVDSNPQNPVIGDRSFGNDPELVANMVVAMARGMSLEGVIPVMKHFPGHGDTNLDSHVEAVTLHHSLERLEQVEFLPFRRAVSLNMPVIMTGHIELKALDEGVPATLSSVLVTDLLRGDWGYGGIVISDALEMGAISRRWTSGEAAVKALSAGVDLLLMPESPQEALDAIVKAVNEGKLEEEQLDQAVTRILALKFKSEILTD